MPTTDEIQSEISLLEEERNELADRIDVLKQQLESVPEEGPPREGIGVKIVPVPSSELPVGYTLACTSIKFDGLSAGAYGVDGKIYLKVGDEVFEVIR